MNNENLIKLTEDINTSLEPNDWVDFRRQSIIVLDALIDMWQQLDSGPVWKAVPDDVRRKFISPIPESGIGVENAIHNLIHDVLPYPRGNIHPRFWGWVNGSGLPIAALADFAASALNSTVTSSESSAMFVEAQVLNWLKNMIEWKSDGDGLLTSGCSMGHIIAISCARQAAYGKKISSQGLFNHDHGRVYASSETHLSVAKAVELLGIGSDNLVLIDVDEENRIRCDLLYENIKLDISQGKIPICIVGNIGTVNTGAIDDIDNLIKISKDFNIWLHLDGAFGVFGKFIESCKIKLKNINMADSICFDLHKWFYMPFDVSCILTRDKDALLNTFSKKSDYMSLLPKGPASFEHSYADRGIEQTRSMRALKLWFSLQAYGIDLFKNSIRKNFIQASFLARLISRSNKLQLLSRGELNIICFRIYRKELNEKQLNDFNVYALSKLQVEGKALPSHTWLDGKFAMRVAINNHRTSFDDMKFLISELEKIDNQWSYDI